MSRPKTEAWLVKWQDGSSFVTFRSHESFKEAGALILPLVRRDPKAEAVLRACENLYAYWVENGFEPAAGNDEPWGPLAKAFKAYKVSKKRKPKN